MIRAAIVGGSGYTGGELLRLLHFHPQVEVTQITSREHAGRYVHTAHPNMRGVSSLKFVHPDGLGACDLLFLALPHGTAARNIERYGGLAPKLIDLSADFRLDCAAEYETFYGEPHPAPRWLYRFVYGLPEVNREVLIGANYVSGVGCNATAVNLALLPLVQAGILERAACEIKVGSSEAGNKSSPGSHHPIRSGAVRSYKATGHRHIAEARLVLGGELPLHFSVTAIEMVRGIHLLAHCYLNQPQIERDIWRIYRARYRDEPFLRLVSGRVGLHRLPEPRVVAGSNYCDIGFELDEDGTHLVVVAALDNLGKGAAGSAVQAMNLMYELDETTGLEFPGVYP
ncbi:MAG: N-acetyl-gamma-glutamyl-phosphate reductase [Chloroflexota bacterium]|nr:N-acetyl-gamma-glutamyl-phosphate reductase [Chloroflexota bacterium]